MVHFSLIGKTGKTQRVLFKYTNPESWMQNEKDLGEYTCHEVQFLTPRKCIKKNHIVLP